jgi:hypothetical protein
MSKSGGDGTKAQRKKKRGTDREMQTVNTCNNTTEPGISLESETERLRNELAAEQQRVQQLEEASDRAAARLDEAIKSVKAILSRQE